MKLYTRAWAWLKSATGELVTRLYNSEVDAEMLQESDQVQSWRRRRSVLGKFLCSFLLMAGGIAGILNDAPLLVSYFPAVFFGVCTACWAIFLLLPPADLLKLPASSFWWFTPSDPEIQTSSAGIQDSAKPPTANAETLHLSSKLWDRELDGGL